MVDHIGSLKNINKKVSPDVVSNQKLANQARKQDRRKLPENFLKIFVEI